MRADNETSLELGLEYVGSFFEHICQHVVVGAGLVAGNLDQSL